MIILLFDLDQTIYNTRPKMNYDDVKYDKLLHELIKSDHPSFILTNATYDHADIVLKNLKISEEFQKIYSRDTMMFMKPHKHCYTMVQNDIERENPIDYFISWHDYYFFDDLLENLEEAKKNGWYTIWIHPDCENVHNKGKHSYVDYSYPNLKIALYKMRLNNIL